jgi:hypothetical protein
LWILAFLRTKSGALSVQIVPAGRVRLTRTRKGQGFRALRLADGIYPYQLTADVGFLKKGGSGKSEKSWADMGKM